MDKNEEQTPMTIDSYISQSITELSIEYSSVHELIIDIYKTHLEYYQSIKQYTEQECKIKAIARTEEFIQKYHKPKTKTEQENNSGGI